MSVHEMFCIVRSMLMAYKQEIQVSGIVCTVSWALAKLQPRVELRRTQLNLIESKAF